MPKPKNWRSAEEQALWDQIVTLSISRGYDARMSTAQADIVIAERRKVVTLPKEYRREKGATR